MLAWQYMHEQHVGNNENRANEMINQLNNWANNMNDNDIIRGREVVQLLTAMNMTVNTVRNTYENQMNLMRRQMEDRIEDLHNEIRHLRNEITRLNNIVHPPPPPPPPQHWLHPQSLHPPPPPAYTKEELCAELLESIEQTKQEMHDQTYRTLTEKLMEIYNR